VIAQAIDATNEAAVRVMVRQVSKELGGVSVVVDCTQSMIPEASETEWLPRKFLRMYGGKELERHDGGRFVEVRSGFLEVLMRFYWPEKPKWQDSTITTYDRSADAIALEVVAAIAGEPDSG
jgi:hypothetical protein